MNELAPRSTYTPETTPHPVERWERDEKGLAFTVPAVHLGRIENTQGGHTYKDEASTLVSEAGFIFNVTQNSAGLTRTSVNPMEGYSITSLSVNETTHLPEWTGASAYSDEVVMSADYGKLIEDDSDAAQNPWTKETVFGNEGIHAGIIKVVGPDDATRYYALAADFEGDADNWDVTAQVAEVYPSTALEAPTEQLES